MSSMPESNLQLYDTTGRRKYLTHRERYRFYEAAKSLPVERKLFCLVLLFTGCRISEALELTVERIDPQIDVLVFRTLKRRKDHQRVIPTPSSLIKDMRAHTMGKTGRIWKFSRRTGWRIVKSVMAAAKIEGIHACPKGLRHGYGMSSAENNVPLKKLQKWMGHSSILTTMIYLDAVGEEEHAFARRTWLGFD